MATEREIDEMLRDGLPAAPTDEQLEEMFSDCAPAQSLTGPFYPTDEDLERFFGPNGPPEGLTSISEFPFPPEVLDALEGGTLVPLNTSARNLLAAAGLHRPTLSRPAIVALALAGLVPNLAASGRVNRADPELLQRVAALDLNGDGIALADLAELLGEDPEDQGLRRQLGPVLRALGFSKKRVTVDGRQVMVWMRPPA